MRYGGADQPANVQIHDAGVSLTNSVLSNSNTGGLRIEGSNPTVTGDTFQNNSGAGISMDDGSSPAISTFTFTNNSINGVVVDYGTITANLTWDNPGVVYVVSSLSVAAGETLTLGADQVVKFGIGYNGITVNGTLVVNGTASQPVTFTSIRDDAAGGDTNNDGSATSPVVGNWNGLYFNTGSGGNVLSNVVVRYGGADQAGDVVVHIASLDLANSVLSNCSTAGLRIEGSNPTLAGDTFQNNFGPAISMDDASSPIISNPTLTNNQTNGVLVDNGYITANMTWNNPGIVYVVNGLTVNAGVTLTIAAGQVVKFKAGYGITINGTLLAQGLPNQAVIFTSLKDDSAVGDTNNDGSATLPAAGDWLGLQFTNQSSGNVLNNVIVRYGGADGYVAQGDVDDQGAGLTVTNSVLSNCSLAGLSVEGASPTLTGDTFLNNAGDAVQIDLASNPAVNGASASGNGLNGIGVAGGTLPGNTTWTAVGLPYALNGSINVPSGDTLTIGASSVFNGNSNVYISGSGIIANAGTFVMSSSTNGTMNVSPQLVNTGTVQILSGTLNAQGGILTNGEGVITGSATGVLSVSGNLGGNTSNADQFAPPNVSFNGGGTSSAPQKIEVMSADQGAVAAGFTNNFAYYSLTVPNGGYTQLVNGVQNSTGSNPEALYVDYLTVPSGATLDLNGLHLYARVAQISGTVLNGTVTTLPQGGPLTLNTTASGSLAASTTTTWNFYSQAGQSVTIVADTGSGSSSVVPLPPTLNYAQITLIDPNGNTVATTSNTTSGADAVLSNVALGVSGTYQVKIQAPAAHSTSSGNYDLTVWNATPQIAALTLGQTATGSLSDPFQIDNYSFTASAGDIVQFNLINSTNPAIAFNLTGPNGYTAFSNATANSGLITLPSAGTYTVSAHIAPGQSGSYAFQVVSDTITALILGTPITQTIQGSGQSHYFALNVTQPGQILLTLQDSASGDQNEIYVNFGTEPNRNAIEPWFYAGQSASEKLSVPTTQVGTYYILVFNNVSVSPGNTYTLTAQTAPFTLSSFTPGQIGSTQSATLLVSGIFPLAYQSATAYQIQFVNGSTVLPATPLYLAPDASRSSARLWHGLGWIEHHVGHAARQHLARRHVLRPHHRQPEQHPGPLEDPDGDRRRHGRFEDQH